MKADGQREVDSMKQRAIAQVQDDIVDLSVQLASQILEKEVTKEKHQEVIEAFIKGVGKIMVKYHKDIVKEASHFYAKAKFEGHLEQSDKRTFKLF